MIQKQKGNGKLLGEGSYGCVYKKNNNIIKILFNNEKFLKEVMQTLLINKIDKNITSTRIENIKTYKIDYIKDKELLKDLKKCDLINRKYPNLKNIYQIIYNIKYYGTDLYDLKNKKIISLDKLLALSLRLYEALELYNSFRVLHSDIKPDNIIYIKESDNLVFIDFGLLTTYDNLFNDYKILKHTYFYYPPEYKLAKALINNNNMDKFIEDFLLNLNTRKKYTNILIDNYKNYYEDLKNMYNRCKEIYDNKINIKSIDDNIVNNIINDIFNDNYKDKLDLYGLSISMYEVIMLYLDYNKDLIDDHDFILQYINNILMPSINFDNDKRLNIKEIIHNFKKLKHKNKEINNILNQKSLKETIEGLENKNNIIKLNINENQINNQFIDTDNEIQKCKKNIRNALLKIAKEKNIKYRHKMKKDELCKKIINL